MCLSIFNIIFLLTIIHQSVTSDWNYAGLGPDVWPDLFPTCSGSSQSPIDIKTACTTYQSFEPFQFSYAYNLTQNFTLTNNGHTISGEQVDPNAFPLTLSGGGLDGTFTFNNFHLHWGENYNSGSEHQL
jgi:carbonic anhydrase